MKSIIQWTRIFGTGMAGTCLLCSFHTQKTHESNVTIFYICLLISLFFTCVYCGHRCFTTCKGLNTLPHPSHAQKTYESKVTILYILISLFFTSVYCRVVTGTDADIGPWSINDFEALQHLRVKPTRINYLHSNFSSRI
jgi:hypothetical protein